MKRCPKIFEQKREKQWRSGKQSGFDLQGQVSRCGSPENLSNHFRCQRKKCNYKMLTLLERTSLESLISLSGTFAASISIAVDPFSKIFQSSKIRFFLLLIWKESIREREQKDFQKSRSSTGFFHFKKILQKLSLDLGAVTLKLNGSISEFSFGTLQCFEMWQFKIST